MIQILNGLEMSLASRLVNILMIDFFLLINRIAVFLESKKKLRSQITHKGIFNY